MKLVVDTNVVFSILVNSNSSLGDIFFNSEEIFEFYSCAYMRYEIRKHWDKLKNLARLSDNALAASFDLLLSRMAFVHEELIPIEIWLRSEELVSDIDIDDVDFVALAQYLNAGLWTGDKTLYNGLKLKQFSQTYNVSDLLALRQQLR